MLRLMSLTAAFLLAAAGWSATIRVAGEQENLAAALAAAQPGDTIALSAGEYSGDVVLDSPVNIVGAGAETTELRGARIAITVAAKVALRDLCVSAPETCIYQQAGSHLTLSGCTIRGAAEDGIGYEPSTATVTNMRDCLVTANGDGVDLEGNQGLMVNCRFVGNRDDGLDYDGDAAVTCLGCRFSANGDDGVEIRIATWTQAVFSDCVFSGNGEDGLEVINTTREEARNTLILGGNRFDGNRRFGVGFVHAEEEEAQNDDRSRCTTLWGTNSFADNGTGPVSKNHLPEMQRAQPTAEQVKIRVVRGEVSEEVTLPLQAPLPVGTISMQPSLDGTVARDLEGVTVDGSHIYLADDDFPGVHVVDRKTSRVVRTIPARPLPGGEMEAKRPEGLSLYDHDGTPALLLAADDGDTLFTLDRRPDSLGAVLAHESASQIAHYPEGVEWLNGTLYFAHGSKLLTALDKERKPLPGFPVSYVPEGFGGHLAGVGSDGERLLVTLAAYAGKRVHTQFSLILAIDPTTGDPVEAWHIPYTNDPRGIACADGIVYVADGMSPFDDPDTGVKTSPGIRVVLFCLGDPAHVGPESLPGR